MRATILVICLSISAFIAPLSAEVKPVSLERAQGEKLATAVGHYARARSLLLAALREFDAGLKQANPQVIIDVKEWREDIINRSEDLDKVIAPQPRSTKHGVQFNPDSRLLSEAYR
ncbi:MAG: hypothetical protein KDD62_07750 [Bdellovibrionales bacterium]|nr:hypothetical protein [Bdellovibrionales bacterium]